VRAIESGILRVIKVSSGYFYQLLLM